MKPRGSKRPRMLTAVEYTPLYETPPLLLAWYEEPVIIAASNPPYLKSGVFTAKTRLPNNLLCNTRSLNNKVEELEVIIKQKSYLTVAVAECWDITDETGRINGYTNFFNTICDKGLPRCAWGFGLYILQEMLCKLLSLRACASCCHEVI